MKISVFGDLHYSLNYQKADEFEEKREQYYQTFMQEFFAQDADLYVSIGDLTNTGAKEEFQGIYSIINQYQDENFVHTIGNHDLYIPSYQEAAEYIDKPLYHSQIHGKLTLIFLNSARQQNVFDWSGYIDNEQMAWFEQTLKESADQTVIVFCHHPVYDTTAYSTADKGSIIPEIPIMDLLKQHKKQAFFINGHTHADSIVSKDNWTFIQIAAVLDQPSIRNIDVTDHSFSIKTVTVSEEHRQVGNWLGCRMNLFSLTDRGYRGEENRNYEIEF